MAGPYDNTAILSKNDRKQTESHPDVKGSADVCCAKCNQTTSYWLDGWRNERKDGSGSFYKLKLKPKDAPAYVPTDSLPPGTHQNNMSLGAPAKTAAPVQGAPSSFTDDQIPF